MSSYRFAAAGPDESIVYGACRPGHHSSDTTSDTVGSWIDYVQSEGIVRVCCLLDSKLGKYNNLLGLYEDSFGQSRVCSAPVPDFQTIPSEIFTDEVLPFLTEADETNEPVVVHCSAGMGRTGHVLALWLAARRGYTLNEAIETVRQTGRAPLEGAARKDLQQLLTAHR